MQVKDNLNPFLTGGMLSMNASLNKVVINDIPGVEMAAELKGKYAYEVLATSIMAECIRKNAVKLGLNLDCISERELGMALERCFTSSEVHVRRTAEEIARYLGRNLGYILATLKLGSESSRKSRPDWSDKHWDFWYSIDEVVIAGGLANGNLGARLKFYAEDVFREAGTEGYKITIPPYSSLVSSVGAARYIEAECENALVFDLGQTFMKRSIASYHKGKLQELSMLKPVKAEYMKWIYDNENEKEVEAKVLNQYILKVLKDAWNEAQSVGFNIGADIAISISNYVKQGKLVDRGGYGKLSLLADDYGKFLSDSLSNAVGKIVRVRLIHDGMAAAAAFAEKANAAVVTLGTAIGVGFPTREIELKPVEKKISFKSVL